MIKRLLSLCAALLLCAAMALPALGAKYPAGMDESLPRVVDGAGLLTDTQIDTLEVRAREIIEQYGMDLVILTTLGTGGETPEKFADDYFDYEGYGWWKEDSDDFNAANGALLLVSMAGPGENDAYISTAGEGESVFRDGVWEQLIDNIIPQLSQEDYEGAFERFLNDAEGCLADYANSADIYADSDEPYNQGYYDDYGEYIYDGGGGLNTDFNYFNWVIFIVALILALVIAGAVVASMKRKHNTIRIAQAAADYQQGFNLTERQDIFLYSNTSRVRIQTETTHRPGGGGFSGGGSHIGSSGRSHGGGGRKF